MVWPESIQFEQCRYILLTIFVNLIALPLMILWMIISILIFPAFFLVCKAVTGWDNDRTMRHLIWVHGRGWLFIMTPFVRVRGEGLTKHEIKLPCIFVVNHLSFFDIYCLALLPCSNTIVTVRSWPFRMVWYAPFMHLARYINIEGMNWGDLSKSALEIMSKGGGILFFPEGHRSYNGKLQRFYSGAFKLAFETGTKIVPLCISGTRELLPPGRWWLRPARITLKALEPVDPKAYSKHDTHRTLRKAVKNMMAEHLAEMETSPRD